jgi:predicted ATPase
MIRQLRLRHFKGWQDLPGLDFGQITVLFGTNSSGKTSLLHSLLLLKQTAESFDRGRALHFGDPQRDFVVLGGFEDVIFGHDVHQPLDLGITWKLERPVELAVGLEAGELAYDCRLQMIDAELVIKQLKFSGGRLSLELIRQPAGKYSLTVQGSPHPPKHEIELDAPESCYGIPHRATSFAQALYPLEFSHEFENLMKRIRYLGPLRQPPDRQYTWSGSRPSSVGLRGEHAVQAMLSDLKEAEVKRPGKTSKRVTGSHAPGELFHEVERWMVALEVAESLELLPLDPGRRMFEVKLRIKGALTDASIADVGVGVSQVLPVIVQLYFTPPGSILLFEQPEIHLHPKVQALLADLFLDAAHSMRHQVIIESHSEHFLVRLQRRIAEAQHPLATPEHVKLYVCSIHGGASRVRVLGMDEYGRIDDWPPDFFGDTLGDREAIMRAMIGRKTAGNRP